MLALVFSRVRGMDSVEVFQELLLFTCMLLDRRMAREAGQLRALIPILHYGVFHTLSCGYTLTHTHTPTHPHTHTHTHPHTHTPIHTHNLQVLVTVRKI